MAGEERCPSCFPNQTPLDADPGPSLPLPPGVCLLGPEEAGSRVQEWVQLWVHYFLGDLNMDSGAPWWPMGRAPALGASTHLWRLWFPKPRLVLGGEGSA